jgi:hypothetical protein
VVGSLDVEALSMAPVVDLKCQSHRSMVVVAEHWNCEFELHVPGGP